MVCLRDFPGEFDGWYVYTGRNVRIAMQDYKFVHVAVMISTTLVNTQAHTELDSF